jgi:hypothetical protein
LLLSLLLLSYYLVLAANWSWGVRVASAIIRARSSPLIGSWLVTFFILLIPIMLKASYLSVGDTPRRSLRWLRIAALFIMPLVLFGGFLLFLFRRQIDWAAIFLHYHWAIWSGVSVALVIVLFFGLLLGSDIGEFLDGFKTFPMAFFAVSVFTLKAPFLGLPAACPLSNSYDSARTSGRDFH